MTTKEVIALVEERGMKIVLVDGRPVLRGDKKQATDKLLAVLKIHREAIIATMLKINQCQQTKGDAWEGDS